MNLMDFTFRLAGEGGLGYAVGGEVFRALRTKGDRVFEGAGLTLGDALKSKPGPGGGRDATLFHAAVLLISLFLKTPRKELAALTHLIYHLRADETSFGDALQNIVKDADFASSVDQVTLYMDGTAADILMKDGRCVCFRSNDITRAPVRRLVEIDGDLLKWVSRECQT